MLFKHIKHKRKLSIIILFIFIIGICFIAFNNNLTVTKYTINSSKINHPIRIVLLTDVHNCKYGVLQEELISKIEEHNPDIILMSGDIADDIIPNECLVELLKGISQKYPCFYVTGNHEFWSGKVNEIKEIFRSNQVTVLEGTHKLVTIQNQPIMICGVDDPEVGKDVFSKQLENVSSTVNNDYYTILLSHRPELFEQYSKHYFDLVLSGHAHGGQWRIPFFLPNGLLAPNQGFFPKFTNGIYEKSNVRMLVSRGLSRESTRIPRVFNSPELVIIVLEPMI